MKTYCQVANMNVEKLFVFWCRGFAVESESSETAST